MITEKDILHFEQEILKFNHIAGNDILDEDLTPVYEGLILEEGEEIFTADSAEDYLDGIVDLGVVGIYWMNLVFPKGVKQYNLRFKEPDGNKVSIMNALEDSLTKHKFHYVMADWMCLLEQIQYDFDLVGAFKEVCDANMTKFPLKSTVDMEKEFEHIVSQGRYSDLTCEEVEYKSDTYLVFRAKEDLQNNRTFGGKGKIVKHSGVRLPDLTPFIK